MDRVKGKNVCPGIEELSAWFDGYGNVKDIGDHIAECRKCLRIIEEYQVIQAMIALGDVAPNEELLNARICSRVRNETIRKPQYRFTSFNSFRRVAALLVIAGCVGLLLGKFIWDKGSSQMSEFVVAPVENTSDAEKILPYLPYYTGYENKLRIDNSIPIQNMVKANYGDRSSTPVFSPGDNSLQAISVPIDSNVHQVWSVANLQNVSKTLKAFTKQNNIMKASILQTKRGTLSLNAVFSKEQLVKLVRHLDGSGYGLLTPNAPQPEQCYFQGFANEKVVYSAEFALSR